MTPARRQVCTQVVAWAPLVAAAAACRQLSPVLVLAIIAQESAGNPYAVRVERGFFRRYLAGLTALVRRTATRWDDYWMTYPDLFSASWGLMQVLYPVAIECGMVLRYPSELCDPARGIEAGCRKLARDRAQGAVSERALLLAYNGGGDLEYPGRIAAWRTDLLDSGLLPEALRC
jgi:soluble lytic murein transglycosylase-like protein